MAAAASLVVAAVLALGALPAAAAVSERIDWETGDSSQTTGLECPSPSDFSIITSPVRQGAHAAHFHLDSRSGLWGNGTPRCLATLYSSAETTGNEYYYGFSLYLPARIRSSNLWELHQPRSIYSLSNYCALAPLALHVEHQGPYNGLYFRVATGNCTPTSRGFSHQELSIPLPRLVPEPIGKWIDFVVHVKFAESSTGALDLWYRLQGARWPSKPLVTRRRIPTMPYCSPCGIHDVNLYTETGLYMMPLGQGQSADLYLDNFRRGSSFRDAAATSGTPIGTGLGVSPAATPG